ncbi:hypothetical protein KI387_010384 [Taxus chinensis]|uniref:Uncharacterized protein n=1 Tax=Taxus chinensis TaxID=29808 RepID=A0AA38FKT4_TAXCH|nr:hypothetical protein KI387_010384 [Taxus chinensis]
MANPFGARFALAVFPILLALSAAMSEDIIRKPYIVHMEKSMKPHQFILHEHWYASLINELTSGTDAESLLLYTYDILLHGFAAILTSAEADALQTRKGCLAVIPSSVVKIHTTRSPHFLGLSGQDGNLWLRSHYGKDVIVGVLDSGIWPESESFHDGGLEPVPSKWKGTCESGYEANYGRLGKSEYKSARDNHGHGTHTAATVAGSPVEGASFSGFANGTATGMAPQARLAIYKVLWGRIDGDGTDIAAAMEKAVADGVDIISMSIGGPDMPFFQDSTAIIAFKAMEKGVFVSASAGNEGPVPYSVSNTAPWMTTVGASTVDREFPGPVMLGNMEIYRGTSTLYRPNVGEIDGNGRIPLVYLSQKRKLQALRGRALSILQRREHISGVARRGIRYKVRDINVVSSRQWNCGAHAKRASIVESCVIKSALMTSAYVRDNRNQLIRDRVFLEGRRSIRFGRRSCKPQCCGGSGAGV